jgi:dipeptidyl aminopeptidase/acylaminoacyl peptidase
MRASPITAFLLALLVSACTSEPPPELTPTVTTTATEAVTTATPWVSPTPIISPRRETATPPAANDPPYRVVFAAGELIDVSPAVVFVDTKTRDAEAWVIPGAIPYFTVAPSGKYILYRSGSTDTPQLRLLRTDDGSHTDIAADAWPGVIAFGPGDSGFVATTQERFLLTAFDAQGNPLADIWRGANVGATVAAWSPDGSLIFVAGNPGGGTLRAGIYPTDTWTATDLSTDSLATKFELPTIRWAPDSQRFALVSSRGVDVVDRSGDLLWQHETSSLRGNPRWSPDGRYLYAYASSATSGGGSPDAYVFTTEGELLARVLSGGDCSDDPWLADSSGVLIERYWAPDQKHYILSVAGAVSLVEQVDRQPSPDLSTYGIQVAQDIGHDYSQMVATTAGGIGDTSVLTIDGHFVFTTPSGGGRDGCAIGVPGVLPPLAVELPPFEN